MIKKHLALSLVGALGISLIALGLSLSPLRATGVQEYKVKAAYLFNFAKFIEWPDMVFKSPSAPMVIAIVGENPFKGDLKKSVKGKHVNNRLIEVKEFASGTPSSEWDSCHILFAASSEEKNLTPIVESTKGKPILTVSEIEGFAHNGGVIGFKIVGSKIKIELNNNTAKENQLKVGAKLQQVSILID